MPTKLFLTLEDYKKKNILEAGILEFGNYSYSNSSTNRIVKNAGISKGSLFQYFKNKEDFYFFILDTTMMQLLTSLEGQEEKLPNELFTRIIKYSELEFSWYAKYPKRYKVILNAFQKNDMEIYQKIKLRYDKRGEDTYYELLQKTDDLQLRVDKEQTIEILKCFLKGFNEEFINRILEESQEDIDCIKEEYIKKLTEAMELLKKGLCHV